jgi:hypothetical protein
MRTSVAYEYECSNLLSTLAMGRRVIHTPLSML